MPSGAGEPPSAFPERLFEDNGCLLVEGVGRRGRFGKLLDWQFSPGKLFGQGIGPLDNDPVVDRPGRARKNARHAELAAFGVYDIVRLVMADSARGAARLAGVAPDADFRVDQMLLLPSHGTTG